MSKPRLWIRAEASGRLIYRRRYPDKLHPFLPTPGLRELKVSLGSTEMTPAALAKYEKAIRQYDEHIEAAQSAMTMQARVEDGGYDTLTPEGIEHLAATFLHNWHVDDEASLRRDGSEWFQAAYQGWDWMLSEYRKWRIDADYYEMEQQWGDQASKLLEAEGIRLSPSDTASRQKLLWALNDVALSYSKDALERLRGAVVAAPPKPASLAPSVAQTPTQLGKRKTDQTGRTVNSGVELIAATRKLPADFAPAIILDASGRVRGTYEVLEQTAGRLKRLPSAIGRYTRLRIHHWHRAASRSALNDKGNRAEILEAAARLINEGHQDEGWLIIHPKTRGGQHDIPAELSKLIDHAPKRLQFIHWGNHHGTNAYRDIRNVMVIGLGNYPPSAYAALHIAAGSEGPSSPTVPASAVRSLTAGEHGHNLLQGISRANVRNGYDGACGDCTVYVIGKAGQLCLKDIAREAFPGAEVVDWQPISKQPTDAENRVLEAIRECFAGDNLPRGVRKADIWRKAGFRQSQGLSQVLKRSEFVKRLRSEGYIVERYYVSRVSFCAVTSADQGTGCLPHSTALNLN